MRPTKSGLRRSQGAHLVILDPDGTEDCDARRSNSKTVTNRGMAPNTRSFSISEAEGRSPHPQHSDAQGRQNDWERSSTTKDEIQYLRATDSRKNSDAKYESTDHHQQSMNAHASGGRMAGDTPLIQILHVPDIINVKESVDTSCARADRNGVPEKAQGDVAIKAELD